MNVNQYGNLYHDGHLCTIDAKEIAGFSIDNGWLHCWDIENSDAGAFNLADDNVREYLSEIIAVLQERLDEYKSLAMSYITVY